ncbi:MAG: N-acetylmuramoyl-L-alanine amidase, partial [Lysobacter sp.]|nr:N-acetylmuramoyl-L-alanine amidase [Lysobacter sp.]
LSETLGAPSLAAADEKSTDYGPALWVASPYHSARTSYDSVTIHTMQGYYAGSISWFQNNPNSVSAHYLIRSSDGQITQMVRENRAAHHVGVHNKTTLGIEHEGFIDNASWYTAAMYNASAALTRHFCATYSAINCASAFKGPAGSGINVLPASVKVKGHQHYSSQTHTDPGINWDWARYYNSGVLGEHHRHRRDLAGRTQLHHAQERRVLVAAVVERRHRQRRCLGGAAVVGQRQSRQQRGPDARQRQGRFLGVYRRDRHERGDRHRRQRRHRALGQPRDSS